SGLIVAGSQNSIGELTIDGNFTQTAGAAMVVKVFNNGFNTVSDRLTVTGSTELGGSLVIGFLTNSLGLVTANFTPFDFLGGLTGKFDRVIDASGNILFIDVTGGVFTIFGISPEVPDELVEVLVGALQNQKKLEEELRNNRSAGEEATDAILDEEEDDDGDSSLVCT
ncbi:MAG: hypothetical protein ACI8XW_003314, partial [Gammaproteobacteria bacterium]